jgi:hypothetical protein
MKQNRIAVAEAFYDELTEFHSIRGKLLSVARTSEKSDLEELFLGFESATLVVTANADDDSIQFRAQMTEKVLSASLEDIANTSPWNDLIGKHFSTGWVAVNQQGYCDSVLLSFDKSAVPHLILTVVASSIKAFRIPS